MAVPVETPRAFRKSWLRWLVSVSKQKVNPGTGVTASVHAGATPGAVAEPAPYVLVVEAPKTSAGSPPIGNFELAVPERSTKTLPADSRCTGFPTIGPKV